MEEKILSFPAIKANVLFILTEKMQKKFLDFCHLPTDDNLNLLKPRSLANYLYLAELIFPVIQKDFDNQWQKADKISLYIYQAKTKNLLVSIQTGDRLSCAAINQKDLKKKKNFYNKPMTGVYRNKIGRSPRLLIISNCLEKFESSPFNYLLYEASNLAIHTIKVEAQEILSKLKKTKKEVTNVQGF
jgi:hypothetical protein